MNELSNGPLQELLDVEDAIQPIIVTISHEDNPDPEGPVLVGFRIRSWGSYFQIVPKVCWMENSGRSLQCGVIPGDDMDAAHYTAVMAVADLIAAAVEKHGHYGPQN